LDYDKALKEISKIVLCNDKKNILQEIVDYLFKNFKTYSWIGIYFVKDADLILGPWQGTNATEHVRIPVGEGICGSAAKSGKTEIVDDVSLDKRYLACFISTRSEIVVPIIKNGVVIGEIDIDSDFYNAFSKEDSIFLEKIADIIKNFC